jgi:hypothetical protein
VSIDATSAMHAPLGAALESLQTRRRTACLDDATFTALYFLYCQIARHGSAFASRRYKNDPRPDARSWLSAVVRTHDTSLKALLISWFERYQFRGVIPNVPAALVHWLRGQWSLRLLEHIPSPFEVLRMQTVGERPVTVITDFPRMLQPVATKKNAYEFVLHDLEHAYKFFYDAHLHTVQRGVFGVLHHALRAGVFDRYLVERRFRERFTYLISDMNTHPAHALHYLRAILVEYFMHREYGTLNGCPLSIRARAEITRVFREFGVLGGFSVQGQHALLVLSQGGKDAASIRAIEDGLAACTRAQRSGRDAAAFNLA